MTPDQIIYTHIKDNLTYTGAFRYGNAKGSEAPYIIMLKVADLETPDTLCVDYGDQGEALFQFSAYTEGGTLAIQEYLQAFKIQVADLKGTLGAGANLLQIWYNETGGVRLLNDGQSTEVIWGAIFETTLRWRYV